MNIRFGANYKLVPDKGGNGGVMVATQRYLNQLSAAKVIKGFINAASFDESARVIVLTTNKKALVDAGVPDRFVFENNGLEKEAVTVLTKADAKTFVEDIQVFDDAGQLPGFYRSFQNDPTARQIPLSDSPGMVRS